MDKPVDWRKHQHKVSIFISTAVSPSLNVVAMNISSDEKFPACDGTFSPLRREQRNTVICIF